MGSLALVVVSLVGVIVIFALARSPRCPVCGIRATYIEEYEVSAFPRILGVAYRCPRCEGLVARRPIGVPPD